MLAAYRAGVYVPHMKIKQSNVKINLELGKALRRQLESDAKIGCRKLSWQALYYIQLCLKTGGIIYNPAETLDDNDGRFTAYVPEEMFDQLQLLSLKHNSNMSAIIRAAILQGMAICKNEAQA